MTDWRIFAEKGNCSKIVPFPSNPNERSELIKMLEKVVPTVTRGDGLEQFQAFIEPHEAVDQQTAEAAYVLGALLNSEAYTSPETEKLFLNAVTLAKKTLNEQLGIKYVGMEDTYLYPRPDGSYKQVRESYGQLICAHKLTIDDGPFVLEKLFDKSGNSYRNLHTWVARYPWRNTMTILGWWAVGNFVSNSSVDHALSILDAEEEFCRTLQFAERHSGENAARLQLDQRFLLDPWAIATLSYRIGFHFAALQKKPIEQDAIKKRNEVKRNSQESGPRGGQVQVWKASERKAVLNRRAKEVGGFLHISDKDKALSSPQRPDGVGNVFFLPDKDAIARAMRLAQAYDKENDPRDKLFWHNKKFLSKEWFENWWAEFKSGQEKFQ